MNDTCRTSTIVRMLVTSSLVIGLALPAIAQQQSKTRGAATQAEKIARSTERSGAPQESIQVHGHWTIVIRNEDGSVASRHEVENRLIQKTSLAQVLGRGASVGSWVIVVNCCGGPPGNSICSFNGAPSPFCVLVESSYPASLMNSGYTTGLTVTVPGSGPDKDSIVLTGTMRASFAGQINTVQTAFALCPIGTTVANCSAGLSSASYVTQHDFDPSGDPPIPVRAQQSIDFTVKLTFS